MTAIDMILRRLRILVDRTKLLRVTYQGLVRLLQISPREGVAIDDVEHLEPAGFSSHPISGAEAVVVNLGGNSGRAVVIVVNDRRYRMVLEEGEAAIYNMPYGDFVKVKADRSVHVSAGLKVYLETPLVEISQDFLVHGNSKFDGTVEIDQNVTMHADQQVDGSVNVDGTSHSTGDITTDGDMQAGSISLKNHRTSGIQRGTEISDGPVV